jgi:hypothetical protein
MKKYLPLALAASILFSCEKEELNVGNTEVYTRATFITICHRDEDEGFQPLQISQQALQAHLNHGDYLPINLSTYLSSINSTTAPALASSL